MTKQQLKSPIPVKILAVLLFLFSLLAFLGSLFMWGGISCFSFQRAQITASLSRIFWSMHRHQ